MKITFILFLQNFQRTHVLSFDPLTFITGGTSMPKIYDGWFNGQISKQASIAVSKALAAGKTKIEVNLPPVPNLEEVKFGTPLNQKFGKNVVAKDLKISNGGYRAGSNISRNLVAYSNIYWAKQIASTVKNPVALLTTEQVKFEEIKAMGTLSRSGMLLSRKSLDGKRPEESLICANPGGEEIWKKIVNFYDAANLPVIMLNNAYSTTYDLGNKQNFEEAYFLKRISKGWIYRAYPGKWCAYLEKPDGTVELLKSYNSKPSLRVIATEVREESFKRFSVLNDRFAKGFGGRL